MAEAQPIQSAMTCESCPSDCPDKVSSDNTEKDENTGTSQEKGDDRPFAHPVYKEVSVTNGIINKMTREEIKRKLDELMLDTKGHKDVLKKRLKTHYKTIKLVQAKVRKRPRPKYDQYIVIDFEATCDEFNPDGYHHEIIEFPIVLIDARNRIVIDKFHSFVKPAVNPKLTHFCTKLTGITQEQVNAADRFDVVLGRAEEWMASHNLNNGKTCALITDGPWDMSRFMFLQCQSSQILFPPWGRKWVNIRKSFCNFYRLRRAKLNMMLANLGMTFEGRPHSGLDDTHNIARIAMRLLADGAPLKLNEELFHDKQQKNQAVVCPVQRRDSDDDCDSDDDMCVHLTTPDSFGVFISGDSCDNGSGEAQRSASTSRNTDGNDIGQLEGGITQLTVTEDVDDLLAYYALQKA